MPRRAKSTRVGVVAAIAMLSAATVAVAAGGAFLEPDVRVLQQFDGRGARVSAGR